MLIPRREIQLTFSRSSGPGGQNVNKVSSRVQLRWNPTTSTAISAEVRARLLQQIGRRLTKEGDLLISSQRYRDQQRNIEDCLARLEAIVGRAMRRPKVRKPTQPTAAARERRLREKKRRSTRKQQRRIGRAPPEE